MSAFRNALQIVFAVLREIFDEAAYERFLQRQSLPSSAVAYKQFLRERESGSRPRARCC